jgi:CheY-like chemotaxis protein
VNRVRDNQDAMTPNRRVLVIDDDIDIRVLLELLFEHAGYTVVTAANGMEGLQAARLARPSVIVLDLMMPVMDGREFRLRQVADPELAGIPVIITSAAFNLAQRTDGLDPIAVLPKPLDFDALVSAVARAAVST